MRALEAKNFSRQNSFTLSASSNPDQALAAERHVILLGDNGFRAPTSLYRLVDLPQMKKEWVLSQDAFEMLLSWLDADREAAGNKYEAIRLRLIKIFTCRGFWEAEELADETINRVVARVAEVAPDYQGDPALYFYGVSQKVQLEYLRKSRLRDSEVSVDVTANIPSPADSVLADEAEPEYECLEQCLEKLPPVNRRLVLEYYQQEKQAKIDYRKRLATELGIAVNALRIRAHRIRRTLETCVRDCLEHQTAH